MWATSDNLQPAAIPESVGDLAVAATREPKKTLNPVTKAQEAFESDIHACSTES
jgi:hypothetical protein